MLRQKNMKLINATLFATCCILLPSCSDSAGESADLRLVTLKVALPQDEIYDMNSPASRSGSSVPGTQEESSISSIKFFIYNAGNDAFETYATSENNAMWDAATQTLRITVTPGNKKIYCIANWADDSSIGMPAIADNILLANLLNQTRAHTNLALTNPPVMTGYLTSNIVGNETNLTMQLTRQIARVELFFKLSDVLHINGADVKVNGVRFLSLPSASYVFPKSPVASPTTVTTWSQAAFAGATSVPLTDVATGYATKYYLPEYVPTAPAKAALIVISATYNGRQTYYSLDINPAVNAVPSHTAYVIERNHTYRYTFTIEGLGADAAPTRSIAASSANITYELEIK